MAPRDEEAVDKIFAGCLENLPPLSSKVFFFIKKEQQFNSNIRLSASSQVPPSQTC